VAITAEFGKNASKAWGDYATNKENELRSLGKHEEADKWREGGTYRAAGHFAIGGLGGGGAGALASGGISLAADKLNSLQDELKDKLIELGMNPDAAQMFSQGAGMATAGTLGTAAGGTVGGGSAFNTDTNNRQLHPDERRKARELTAKAKAMGLTKPDGSAYTQEDIEEQMRLMGNAKTGEQPNTVTVLTNTAAIEKSLKDDPGMPKTAQGAAVVEVPGKANAPLQSWIIDNTRDGFQYIPGQSPYSPSNAALNGPQLTNTPNDPTKTAACANNDLVCKSGAGAQQSSLPELPQSAKKAIADVAADTSRQAGVIGSGATAATAVVPPALKPVTGAVAVGATVIGVGADAVEQVVRPDTGQTVTNLFGASLQEAANNTPIGKVASPITNELIETWKKSDTNQSIQDWVNERLKKLRGEK
jgi:filamentous hemagglutinin